MVEHFFFVLVEAVERVSAFVHEVLVVQEILERNQIIIFELLIRQKRKLIDCFFVSEFRQ